MTILDGRKVSNQIKDEIAEEVKEMKENGEKVPHLAAIIVGNDGASLTYVASKVRACERIGFESTLVKMSNTTSEVELLDKIDELNNDDDIDGFIVQLPLPPQIDTQKVLMAVDPNKDVVIGGFDQNGCNWSNHMYEGAIDDVMFFERALTEQDIESLYN